MVSLGTRYSRKYDRIESVNFENSVLKLADFGCSTIISPELSATVTNAKTAAWVAPEVAAGFPDEPHTGKSDVFSLGLIPGSTIKP